MSLYKNGHTDQWMRTETPEINPCIRDQLIYNKGIKNIQWGKSVSSVDGIRKAGQHMQKNETGPLSFIIHKNELRIITTFT